MAIFDRKRITINVIDNLLQIKLLGKKENADNFGNKQMHGLKVLDYLKKWTKFMS